MKQNKYSLGNKLSNEFLNKKIIVTGASSGIGLTTALYFLNCGAKVILAGRDIKTMKKICEDNKFYNAIIMKLELKDDISIYDFKTDGDLEKTYPQDFDYTLDVNLRSMFYLINNLSSFMEKNSSIINMSCLYGTNPMAGMISHNVSKAGLEALTRYAAAEFSGFGIRVNAITACPVDTNSMRLMQVENSEIEKFNKNMEKNIPLGRIARPDDITKVIVFLASERSKNITGQIIRVDGGRGLTSSGYVHYRGMMNMNSRFEPDGEKKQINNLFGLGDLIGVKIKKKEEVPKDEKELKRFINNKIKESNFSTNLSDAFASSNPSYKIVDNNDQRLTDKFLKGKNPNPLYDLKKYKKQIYGKNTGFASVNIIMNNDSMQMPNQNLNRTQIKPAMSFNNNLQNNNFNLNKSNGPEDSKPNYN